MQEDERAEWIGRIAERKIADAIEQGVFENLPGRGKPLPLDDDAGTPPHMRAANRVLKNAGVVPDWIAVENEIEAARRLADRFRDEWLGPFVGCDERQAELAGNMSARSATAGSAECAAARAKYERLMRDVNNQVLKHNLSFSFVHRSPHPMRIKQRLADWDDAIALSRGG